jgi:NADH pyrophosphatase NudC (nudix superfamily)
VNKVIYNTHFKSRRMYMLNQKPIPIAALVKFCPVCGNTDVTRTPDGKEKIVCPSCRKEYQIMECKDIA